MDGKISVVMTLDDSGFTLKADRAGQTISTLQKNLGGVSTATKQAEGGITSLGASFEKFIFTLSLVRYAMNDIDEMLLALPKSVVGAAASFEKMQVLMKGLSKEATDSAKTLDAIANTKYVVNLSLNTPFNIKSIQEAFVLLKSGGIDPTKGAMVALTDSVAKFGGSGEVLQRAALAVQQMAGKGVVSMQELRQQLGEAVPTAMRAMADGMGLTMAQLTKEVSKGQVEATSALDRMFAVMNARYSGAAKDLMMTWDGMMEQTKTHWSLFLNDIGNAGGDNSFFSAVKKNLGEINKLFEQPEIKKFAYDLGQGLLTLVNFGVQVVGFFQEWGGTIKMVGEAFLLYFGANKIRGILESIGSIKAKALDAMVTNPNEKQGALGSFFQGQAKGQSGVDDSVAKQRASVEEMISINKKMYDDNLAAIGKVEGEQAKAHAQAIANAEAELAQVKIKAQAEMTAAGEKLNQAGKYYKEAYDQQRNLDAIQSRGNRTPTGQFMSKDSINNIAQQAQMYRELTTATSRQAEAMNAEALASIKSAEAKVAAVAATRDYTIAAKEQQAILASTNTNIANTVQTLEKQANGFVSAGTAARTFSGVLGGMQSVFTAFGGWITVAIAGITLLIEAVVKWMNAAQHAEETMLAIKNGVATKAGVDEVTGAYAAAQKLLGEMDLDLLNKRKAIQTATDNIAKGGTDYYIAQQTRMKKALEDNLQSQLDSRKAQAAEVARIGGVMGVGKKLLVDNEASVESNYMANQIQAGTQKAVEALRAQGTTLDEERDKLEKAIKDKYPKDADKRIAADPTITKLTKDINANLVAVSKTILDAEVAGLAEARSKLAVLPQGSDAFTIQDKIIQDAQKRVQAATETFNKNQQIIGTRGTIAAGKDDKVKRERTDKADPLTQFVDDERAKYEDAKLQLEQVKNDTSQMLQSRYAATIEIIRKLSNGQFDSVNAAGKATNYEKGKPNQYMEQFVQFLASGKTNVDDFVDSLGNLDKKSQANSEHLRVMLKQYIDEAEATAKAKAQIVLLTEAKSMASKAQEGLNAAMEDYDARSNVVSSGMLKLIQQFDGLEKKAKDAGRGFAEFSAERDKAFLAQLNTDIYKDQLNVYKEDEKNRLAMITNIADREQAAHEEKMANINLEADARVKEAMMTAASENRDNTLAAIEHDRVSKQRVEQDAYFLSSQTGLQKMALQWQDTSGQITTATQNWAKEGMDAIEKFTETGKLNFSDLIKNIITDFAKVSLQQTYGDVVSGAAKGVGTVLTGLTGNQGKSESAADSLGKVDSVAKEVSGTLQGWVSKLFPGLATSMADNTVKETAKGVQTVQSTSAMSLLTNATYAAANALMSLGASGAGGSVGGLSKLFGGGSASASTIEELSQAGIGFANGGIMTSQGKVPLKRYSSGGIANSAQLAMFGEGSMNEAYVPLPDGKTIPVTLQGSLGTTSPQTAGPVQVNVYNQSGTSVAAESSTRFDGKQMILDVVLTAASSPGGFRDGLKSAVSQ